MRIETAMFVFPLGVYFTLGVCFYYVFHPEFHETDVVKWKMPFFKHFWESQYLVAD